MNFTIKVPPVTKKNSQQIIPVPIPGTNRKRLMVLPSKAYRRYEKEVAEFIPEWGIDYPINIKATFYMGRRGKVDLVNLEEALCDVLVKHGCITDDNSQIIVSMDGSRVSYDKLAPRTEVTIERVEV